MHISSHSTRLCLATDFYYSHRRCPSFSPSVCVHLSCADLSLDPFLYIGYRIVCAFGSVLESSLGNTYAYAMLPFQDLIYSSADSGHSFSLAPSYYS